MNFPLENLLLYLNLILLVISIIYINKKYSRWLISCAVLSVAFALLLLLYYFLTSDFSVAYIYNFSSTDLPLVYKISAVLAGQSGTLLFWAFMVDIQALWLVRKRSEVLHMQGIIRIVLAIGAVFVFFTILNSPFNSFSSVYAEEINKMGLPPDYVPVEGQGLSLVLQDPWMAVHPPLTFTGYSLLTIPFAAAIIYLRRGFPDFTAVSGQWARSSWFFLTLAIATGSYWTYKIFAGAEYWTWDPVETSSLIPWLTLTAYLHIAKRHQEFRFLPPVLIICSFILTVYATFVTRSGLWPSVHAFAGTSENVAILIFLVILSVLSSAVILLGSGRTGKNSHKPRRSPDLDHYTVILLSILALICFFGITFSALNYAITGDQSVMQQGFFNVWTFPFVLGLVLLMALCQTSGLFSGNTLKKCTAFVLTASIALALISIRYPLIQESRYSTNPGFMEAISIHSFLPIFVFSVLAIVYVFYRDMVLTAGRHFLRNAGSHMIHIGVALIVFGVIMSTSFDTQYSVRFSITEIGSTKNAGDGYFIQLNDLKTGPEGSKWVQSASLSIYKGQDLLANGTSGYISIPTGGGNIYAMIHHGIFSDVYTVFHSPYAEPDPDYFILPVTLRILPFSNLVWYGIFLFSAGMGIRIIQPFRGH